MRYNLNGGYGRVIADRLSNGFAGKVFIVGASGLAGRSKYTEIFSNDPDGKILFAASIAGALTQCTADVSDTIYVLPGHTENVSAAAGITLNVVGVNLIGLGKGSDRPTITFDTGTTSTLTITAANVSVENFIFTQAFDAIVSPIVISAANVTLKNNYFMVANATYQATQMILTTAAANNLTVVGNRFEGTSDAGTTAAITLVGGDNANITDNDFIGAYSSGVGAIRSITTLVTNCVIKRNTIVNVTTSATKAITLLTGSTGIITGNMFGIGSGTAPITADASWWGANYSAAAVATNATLV